MAVINEKDFIQVEYTGKLKEGNIVFDTTNEDVAKKEGLHNEGMPYGNVIVWLGEGQLLPGIEKALVGKEVGKDLTIELSAEGAFGKKDAKMLKLVPTTVFRKQKIEPMPGLQVNIDGTLGTIRTVTGGRTVVDFNHPLSGKDVVYNVKVNKIITDVKEKVSAYVKMQLNMKDVEVEVKEGDVEIKLPQEFPKEINELIQNKVKEISSSIKSVNVSKKG